MRALGFPGSLVLELLGDTGRDVQIRAKVDPLLFSTALAMECTLAQKCGMSLSAYHKLPRKERRTWFFFHILEGKKEERAYEKSREESEKNARMNNPASSRSR